MFTTPTNSLGSSAVCAFRMEDIYRSFDGQFKAQEDTNSNWLPVAESKVPSPRPGSCSNDSASLPEATLNFIKDHPLMDAPVQSYLAQPLLIQSGFKSRFTVIAIDPQVEAVSGKTYDVLFIGTDDGRVLKVINSGSNLPPHGTHASDANGNNNNNGKSKPLNGASALIQPVIIEDIQIFNYPTVPITNLRVHHTFFAAKLIVVSNHEIQSIPLFKCNSRGATSCGKCVALQDPYCAWDKSRNICTSSRSRFWNSDNFIQNIEDGADDRCGPEGSKSTNGPSSADKGDGAISGERSPSIDSKEGGIVSSKSMPELIDESTYGRADADLSNQIARGELYTGETLAFSIVTSIVTSLVIGFILGYIFSKRCSKSSDDRMMMSHAAMMGCSLPYDDPTGYIERSIHHHVQGPDVYGGTLSQLGHGPLQYSGGGGVIGTLSQSGGPPQLYGLNTTPGGGISQQHQQLLIQSSGGSNLNNKPINLVLNVPNSKNGKNANSSADNKPAQKVKKIYL